MKKLSKLSNMPYYGTRASIGKTKGQIIDLLEKYNIKNHSWTTYEGKESLAFTIDLENNSRRFVQLEVPEIRGTYGSLKKNKETGQTYYESKDVPREQKFRLLYHSLKGLLESTKYGFLKLEDVFYTNTMVKIGDSVKKLGELRPKVDFLLTEGT